MSQRTGITLVIALAVLGALLLIGSIAALIGQAAVASVPPSATVTPIDLATPTNMATSVATTAPTPTPVPKPDIGVQGQFIGPDGANDVRLAANLGVGWIKQQIDWNSVEYARGLYHWSEIDQLVAEAQRHGLKLLFMSHPPLEAGIAALQ